jgi:hypothetical protein
LEHDLQELMLPYGRCHVNIRISSIKKMPSGFVQYEVSISTDLGQSDNPYKTHEIRKEQQPNVHLKTEKIFGFIIGS